MPHIVLETTSDLQENGDIPDILEALVEELCKHETVRSEAVKAYHTLRSVWAVGEGHPDGFAHCTVLVLAGRPLELRKEIANAMMDLLRQRFSGSMDMGEVGLTLEVREMDADTYLRA